MKIRDLLVPLSILTLAPLAVACDPDPEMETMESDTDGGTSLPGYGTDDGSTSDEGSTTGDDGSESDGSDSDGSTTDPDSEGMDTDGENECGQCGCIEDFPPPEPANIMLVLDKSGSMVNQDNFWDHDGDDADDDGWADGQPGEPATPPVSRWNSLHGVVSQVAGGFGTVTNMGAQLFPSTEAENVLGPEACVVSSTPEVAVAPDNAATLLSSIPPAGALNLAGGTPAAAGVYAAAEHLTELPGEYTGAKYMLLITDGTANCSANAQDDLDLLSYDSDLEVFVDNARAGWNGGEPITTVVVGIDIKDAVDNNGTNAHEVLNSVAELGGAAQEGEEQFYNATNQVQLESAIHGIVREVSCTIPFGEGGFSGDSPFELEFEINGMTYAQLPDGTTCDEGTGWEFADDLEPHQTLRLCGKACDAYIDSGELTAEYTCPDVG